MLGHARAHTHTQNTEPNKTIIMWKEDRQCGKKSGVIWLIDQFNEGIMLLYCFVLFYETGFLSVKVLPVLELAL